MDKFNDNPISLIEFANAELSKGNINQVIDILQEEIQNYEEFPLLFILLARAYYEVNDFENARRIVSLGLEKFPFNKGLQQLDEMLNEKIQTKANYSIEINFQNLNPYVFPFLNCFKRVFKNRIISIDAIISKF